MENDSYLAIISDSIPSQNMLSESDINTIQQSLWGILAMQVQRYTMGDSSSVPVETAQELLNSICFCIRMYMKEASSDMTVLKELPAADLFMKGRIAIEKAISEGRKLLSRAIDTSPHGLENLSYKNTLSEIANFFKNYDYRFLAHDIPCSIDYQLSQPVSEKLLGIEYINEYLRRINIENKFISHFVAENVVLLLENCFPDYKGLLINLYEPVAVNAIGLALIDGNIETLDITEADRLVLLKYFCAWPEEAALEKLQKAAAFICSCLYIDDEAEKIYIKKTAMDLYPRISAAVAAGSLNDVFLSSGCRPVQKEPDSIYVDSNPMDNERLRSLISEIEDCRYLSDKIKMVQNDVHSLGDLTEILNVCFWGDDCDALFNALGKEIVDLLVHYVNKKYSGNPDWGSESGWELMLKQYTAHIGNDN